MAFRKVIYEAIEEKDKELTVLSIGDSEEEKKAVFGLKSLKFFRQLKVKCVETMKCPDPLTIIKQNKELLASIEDGFLNSKDHSIKLKI